ncbi:MAG: glycerophosphodiester phosphodiesterase family protein [Mogibacterium sp.]|nr:glycerophosphodiester phosphodiesterase family protein [Mogibacterium sp.]
MQFPGFIEECHKEGIAVNVWTVDSDEYIEMSCRAGVDAIITNYPDKTLETIRRLI